MKVTQITMFPPRGGKKKNKPTYRKFFIINVELLKAKNQYK